MDRPDRRKRLLLPTVTPAERFASLLLAVALKGAAIAFPEWAFVMQPMFEFVLTTAYVRSVTQKGL